MTAGDECAVAVAGRVAGAAAGAAAGVVTAGVTAGAISTAGGGDLEDARAIIG